MKFALIAPIINSAIVLAFLYGAKIIADMRTAFDDDNEIEENSNLAVGIRRFGLYLGMAIALTAPLLGESLGLGQDIKLLLIEGAFALVALFVARIFNDAIVLRSINNDKAVLGGNTAVGLVEFGHYVATGLIINGSLTGEGGGILSVLMFFIIGQLALLIMFGIYEAITAFNVNTEIKNGNPAAGVGVAGMLVSLGIILRYSIAGPFVSWSSDLKSFTISFVLGVIMLLVFRAIIDKVFLPNTDLETEVRRDRNVAALVIAQGVLISLSLIIGAAI